MKHLAEGLLAGAVMLVPALVVVIVKSGIM
jgi:hypothetical protein